MITFILALAFSLVSCSISTLYAIYEMKVNKNKAAGIIILLSVVGVIFPAIMYYTV